VDEREGKEGKGRGEEKGLQPLQKCLSVLATGATMFTVTYLILISVTYNCLYFLASILCGLLK
jgi:hypothetical protein